MAPTETLAEQHFLTIEPLCTQLGVRVALLTGSVKSELAGAQIVVGTHALIQEGVDLPELAVAVVDEQHRFGVEQRRALTEGRAPHVLHMTATPIPRTLALTLYGDLSVTEIAKPPASRKPIVTAWVTAERSSDAYKRLRAHLDAGRQAYVVCPLIEESETSQSRAAEAEAERLRRAELREYRVGLLHGRLRPAERRELMAQFKARELDVLVATTVIEVGVDVPNATIMIVQEADRFGLAQLHQLRGRVGRGAEQSYCLLISRPREELTDNAQERLQALVDSTDGFELAEKRPRAARRGPAARHAPGRRLRPALRPLARRPAAARARALGGRGPRRLRRPAGRGGRAGLRRARARGVSVAAAAPAGAPPVGARRREALGGGFRARAHQRRAHAQAASSACSRASGHERGRVAAAYVLGFSGESEVAGVLAASALRSRASCPAVRAHAAEALGHLLQFEPVLAENRSAIVASLTDPEPEVRFWCAFAAGALELQESRPRLERLRDDDALLEDWWTVGQEAEWALRCLDGEVHPPLPDRV